MNAYTLLLSAHHPTLPHLLTHIISNIFRRHVTVRVMPVGLLAYRGTACKILAEKRSISDQGLVPDIAGTSSTLYQRLFEARALEPPSVTLLMLVREWKMWHLMSRNNQKKSCIQAESWHDGASNKQYKISRQQHSTVDDYLDWA